jgi:HSP20 family protein
LSDWNDQNWKQYADQMLGDEFFNNFKGFFKSSGPDINMYDSGNELICMISLPGVNSIEEIDLYINYDRIHISGSSNFNYKGFRLLQEEIIQGKFERKIRLPYPVREDKIDASYQKGILNIHLHRLLTEPKNKNRPQIREFEE